jgi:hypothetical protein
MQRIGEVCQLQIHAPQHLGEAGEWMALCQVNLLTSGRIEQHGTFIQ